jgi:hypothetical protein
LGQPKDASELVHDAGLSAGDNYPVDPLHVSWDADFDNLATKLAQNGTVLAHIALKCENPDSWGGTTSHVQRDGEVREDRSR